MSGIIWMIFELCFVTSVASETFVCNSLADSLFGMDSGHGETLTRIEALETQVKQLQILLQQQTSSLNTVQGLPRDCEEIYRSGTHKDGVYSISPDGRCPFFVYCDMTNGGWTVIQKRLDGSVSFYQPWNDYVQGFGEVDSEHWLGLEKIHRLTKYGSQIYFNLTMWDNSIEFAHYKVFTVHGAATVYRMNVDSFGYHGSIKELLSYHDNQKFSTFDRDNDAHGSENCCLKYLDGGGWWYNSCYRLGNPNGVYGKKEQGGIGYWDSSNVPVKTFSIKIKTMSGTC